MRSARRIPLGILLVLLVGVPLLELWTLIQVGQVVGPWWTIALLLAMGLAGGWLLRHEGTRAWRAFAEALAGGRMPHREIADGALIVLAGALMLTPGFVTDAVGVLLVLPGTRGVARRALTAAVGRWLAGSPGTFVPPGVFGGPGGPTGTARPGPRDARHPGPGPEEGPVVRGEVVDP